MTASASSWIHTRLKMSKCSCGIMPWNWLIVVVVLLVMLWTQTVDSIVLPPIHWNSSNPMFKTSNNDHIIEVNLFDEVDFVCPHHPRGTSTQRHEYYIIYQVSRREYDDCNLYSDTHAAMIVNCSSPNHKKRFTILFESFGAIPNVPEFKAGQKYYYISTSTGSKEGIMNPHQGACLYNNMKLSIRVCCETTTTSAPTLAPNTTQPSLPYSAMTRGSPTPTHAPPATKTTPTPPRSSLGGSTLTGSSKSPVGSSRNPASTTTTTTRSPHHSTTLARWRPKTTSQQNTINTDKGSQTPGKGKGTNPEKPSENSANPKREPQVNGSRTLHLATTTPVILLTWCAWLLGR